MLHQSNFYLAAFPLWCRSAGIFDSKMFTLRLKESCWWAQQVVASFLSRVACRELWPRERRKLQVIFHSNKARGGEKYRKVLISCCSLGEVVFVANWKKRDALNILKIFEYLSVFNCLSFNLTFYSWKQLFGLLKTYFDSWKTSCVFWLVQV